MSCDQRVNSQNPATLGLHIWRNQKQLDRVCLQSEGTVAAFFQLGACLRLPPQLKLWELNVAGAIRVHLLHRLLQNLGLEFLAARQFVQICNLSFIEISVAVAVDHRKPRLRVAKLGHVFSGVTQKKGSLGGILACAPAVGVPAHLARELAAPKYALIFLLAGRQELREPAAVHHRPHRLVLPFLPCHRILRCSLKLCGFLHLGSHPFAGPRAV